MIGTIGRFRGGCTAIKMTTGLWLFTAHFREIRHIDCQSCKNESCFVPKVRPVVVKRNDHADLQPFFMKRIDTMSRDADTQRVLDSGIVAIIRAPSSEQLVQVARTLLRSELGGSAAADSPGTERQSTSTSRKLDHR